MDDWALYVTASDLAKSIEQWGWDGLEQIEPSFWKLESYSNAAALAQAILAEREEERYHKLRRQARRKRSQNRKER